MIFWKYFQSNNGSSSPFRINSLYAEREGCGSNPHWEQ